MSAQAQSGEWPEFKGGIYAFESNGIFQVDRKIERIRKITDVVGDHTRGLSIDYKGRLIGYKDSEIFLINPLNGENDSVIYSLKNITIDQQGSVYEADFLIGDVLFTSPASMFITTGTLSGYDIYNYDDVERKAVWIDRYPVGSKSKLEVYGKHFDPFECKVYIGWALSSTGFPSEQSLVWSIYDLEADEVNRIVFEGDAPVPFLDPAANILAITSSGTGIPDLGNKSLNMFTSHWKAVPDIRSHIRQDQNLSIDQGFVLVNNKLHLADIENQGSENIVIEQIYLNTLSENLAIHIPDLPKTLLSTESMTVEVEILGDDYRNDAYLVVQSNHITDSALIFDLTKTYLITGELNDHRKVVNIFPNPANDYVNIRIENATITQMQLFDISGKSIFYLELRSSNLRLNTSTLSGIHMLYLNFDDHSRMVKRIIINSTPHQ